jgi:hypothetical protein
MRRTNAYARGARERGLERGQTGMVTALQRKLKRGARIVSHWHHMGDGKPVARVLSISDRSLMPELSRIEARS